MIERSGLPGRSVVARLAGLRESAGHVVRVRRVLEILQVARHASIRGQVVVIVDVAIRAGPRRHRVHTGQSEVHGRMIEGRRRPT